MQCKSWYSNTSKNRTKSSNRQLNFRTFWEKYLFIKSIIVNSHFKEIKKEDNFKVEIFWSSKQTINNGTTNRNRSTVPRTENFGGWQILRGANYFSTLWYLFTFLENRKVEFCSQEGWRRKNPSFTITYQPF